MFRGAPNNGKDAFVLETLEARVLLSGAPLDAGTATAPDSPRVGTVLLAELFTTESPITADPLFDGVGLDDLGGGLEDLGTPLAAPSKVAEPASVTASAAATVDSEPGSPDSPPTAPTPDRPRSGHAGLAAPSVSGTLTADTVWSDTVRVTGDVTVAAGVKLTLLPGTVVKFDAKAFLNVLGTLDAQGTAAAPVAFTSVKDDLVGEDLTGASVGKPADGDWESLYLRAGSDASTLRNVVIRYAGSSEGPNAGAQYSTPGLLIEGASPTLSNIRIEDSRWVGLRILGGAPTIQNLDVRRSGSWPIYMDLAAAPKLSGLLSTDNALEGILVDRGTLPADRTWDQTALPYVLNGGNRFDNGIVLTVPESVTLTLKPGVVVKLANEMALNVLGTLHAVGTAAQPIYLTSWQDDSVGGDSFRDGSLGGALARPGAWESVIFTGHSSDASRLENVVVRYAGNRYGPTDGAQHNQPAVRLLTSNAVLKDVQIRDVRDMGVRIEGGEPTLDGVDVQGAGSWPFSMNLAANPVLRNITASGNSNFGLLVDRGTFEADRVWNVTTMPYVLTGGARFDNGIVMNLPAERKLTIAPGVVIKTADEMAWVIRGTLLAQGTVEQPIYFTGWSDDSVGGDSFGNGVDGGAAPRPGDWESLILEDATSSGSRLENVVLRYAGNAYGPTDGAQHNQAAIRLTASDATLANVRIRDVRSVGVRIEGGRPTLDGVDVQGAGSWPIYMNLAANPVLKNVTASGNANIGLLVDRGTLPEDRVWDVTTMPYVLTGGSRFDNGISMVIPLGRKLTIAPGVIVKSASEMVWVINGVLDAAGTEDRPVVFTSWQDDAAGGDSFGDGAEGTIGPRPGNWESLVFDGHDSDASRLENVVVRYAGNAYGPTDNPTYNVPAIRLTDSNALLKNVRLREIRHFGVRIENGRPTLDGVDVQGGARGRST